MTVLVLSESENIQFGLMRNAIYDFGQAQYCAEFLLKKGWHAKPWERRGTIYNQQTAFVTNVVIAYGRPFAQSRGKPTLKLKLSIFTESEKEIHHRLMFLRNEIIAHSDLSHTEYRPFNMGSISTIIEGRPSYVLTVEECEKIVVMTMKAIKYAKEKSKYLLKSAAKQQGLEFPDLSF